MKHTDIYSLFELSPIPMWVFDVATLRFLVVNVAATKNYGYTKQEFLTMTINQIRPSEDVNRIEQLVKANARSGIFYQNSFRHLRKNGDLIYVDIASNLIEFEGRKARLVQAFDVTDKYNVQLANIERDKLLQQNIERYNIVSKATSDIIWDYNFEADTILWNRAIKGVLGYKDKEKTTLGWWKENIHPEDRKRVVERFEHYVRSSINKWDDEYRFQCADGDYKYIYDRGFVLLDEDGRAYRMIGAMQDVTAKKEEENWSKLLESVVINTTDGVLITDTSPEPNIIYVNDALLEMSGYSKQELLGQPTSTLHSSENQNELAKLTQAITNGVSCKVELSNVTKQGHKYFVSISLNPVFDEKGKLERWVSIQRDISEQHKYVEEIETQNKKLSEIRWIQSHVARAPLARMKSLVELLAYTTEEIERQELMDLLKDSADELDQIISTIANQSKLK